MTIKQFFKSKAFKCIITLLIIALISGGLLSILNDLWYVSDTEKINRAIKSVCGDDVSLSKELVVDGLEYTSGTIDGAYLLSDGSHIVLVTGKDGYHAGTVSLYVRIKKSGEEYTLTDAVIASYASSQTLMNKFTDKVLENFVNSESNTYVESGASYSSKAINNAIKTAKEFAKNDIENCKYKEGEGND